MSFNPAVMKQDSEPYQQIWSVNPKEELYEKKYNSVFEFAAQCEVDSRTAC